MSRLYYPGDPFSTHFLKDLTVIAGLIRRDTTMFLTSAHWRQIVAELDAQYSDCLMDPTRPAPWHTRAEFTIHQMGDFKLTIVNSGTEDQAWVNAMNRDTPGAIDFIETRDRMRIA